MLVRKANTPSQKINALFALCEQRASLNTDSLLAYAGQAVQIAQQQNNQLDLLRAKYYTYTGLLKNSLYDSVIIVCDSGLHWLAKNSADKKLRVNFNYLKAQALIRSNRYKEALTVYYNLLPEAESSNDTLMQIKIRTGIGWVNMEMNQLKEALDWFYQAMFSSTNPDLYGKYPILYSNMASTYNNMGKYDSAFYYIQKSVEGAIENQELSYLANALNIRADIYMNTQKNMAAEQDLTRALDIRKQVGDPFYIVSDITQLSNFYASTQQYQKGIDMAGQGLQMAIQYKLNAKLPILYGALAENYKRAGDYQRYSEVQEKIISLKDSLFEKNSAQSLADLQAKYDVQKKENIIIQQKLDIVSKDYWFYSMLTLFIFLGTIGIIQYFNYRKKETIKMEKLVAAQRHNETIAVLKAEEKERKRIAADLHDNLGAYAAAISNNVRSVKDAGHYNDTLTLRLEENAQDIVNELNNTIWVLKKETQHLTEISDRLKVWLQKLIHNYPAITYDFNESLDNDMVLSPANALQLYHILQECINNALRHSQCTHIYLTFTSEANWIIRVADNGIGFDLKSVNIGNGITNLQERAAACGWKIAWETSNGTTVMVTG